MGLTQRIYSKNPELVFRKIASESILVPIRHKTGDLESIYTLNEVGGRIWELVDGKRSVLEICEVIAEEFCVTPQEAEEDAISFLKQLEAVGIVAIS